MEGGLHIMLWFDIVDLWVLQGLWLTLNIWDFDNVGKP